MNPGGRLVLVVLGTVLLVASAAGIPILSPHRLVGVSTGTLIGWGMILAVPALLVSLALVNHDRMKQLKRHQAENTRLLNELRGRGKVIEGPWRKSG